MRILLVAVVLGSLASCADDGVRHTPDATSPDDAAADAAIDAALTPAMLSGSPGATAFGDVVLGQTTAKVTYTISNDGEQTSGTLGVLLDSTTAGFAISENLCSGVALAPHETCTFNVSFQPSVAGLAMTTVHAGTSPGGEVARDLTGTGLQPGAIEITEASHDYLSLAVDAAATSHTFTVKNTGQVAIGIPMPEITGTVDSYSIASTTCAAMLAPMATCAVVVHFDPPTVGMKPGSLVVTASPGGSDSATLAGTGFAHVAVTKSGSGTVTSSLPGIDCGSSCAADFTTTPVSLTEVPATGWMFAGWTVDCSGTVSCTLDLTAHKNVTATFTLKQFTLTTATTGTGSGTVTGAGTYPYNTPVTVTASPANDSTFTGFSGACTGMGPCTVTMTQARAVTAGFDLIPETLTVTTAAPGGTITSTPAGISCTAATCAHDFGHGRQVVLTATPDPGYKLAVWAGDCSGTPLTSACTVTMDQARSVTANFTKQQFTLTTATVGTGTGTVTGAGTYAYNTPVTVTASPDSTSTFTGFSGACTGPTNPCTVTMTANLTVSAGFDLIPEKLTVSSPTGGTLTSSPAGINCIGGNTGTCVNDFGFGIPVTLTAKPDTGAELALWGGACSGVPATTPTCTVTMNQAQSVSVRWRPIPFTLNLSFLGDSGGSVTNSASGITYTTNSSIAVQYGEQLTLTEAVPVGTGTVFWAWGGACSGNATTCTITVTGDTNVSAEFDVNSYRYLFHAITTDTNWFAYDVTYPQNATTSAECASTATPGTACAGSLARGTVVKLVAHPSPFLPAAQWHDLPKWSGCDSVSADSLTCTFTLLSSRTNITVSGDTGQ